MSVDELSDQERYQLEAAVQSRVLYLLSLEERIMNPNARKSVAQTRLELVSAATKLGI